MNTEQILQELHTEIDKEYAELRLKYKFYKEHNLKLELIMIREKMSTIENILSLIRDKIRNL